MRSFWIPFTDGSHGCCDGESEYDAVRIAEKFTGKTAVVGENKYKPDIKSLPYPSSPNIWQYEHPLNGKCPLFCYRPEKCAGLSCCPNDPCCTN